MGVEDLVVVLRSQLGNRVAPNAVLARHTSFRIGGPAEVLVTPETVEDLALALRAAAEARVRVTLVGGGSNVLIGDGGIGGVVVKLGRGFARIDWSASSGEVRAGAAVQMGKLSRQSVARGLAGLEYAEGIPGTVGGALFMNAGAYGGDISSAVAAVEGIEADGTPRTLTGVRFTYRHAELPAGFVVTAVRFALRPEDPTAVRARAEAARTRRTASQPHGNPSAGSIFKNPPGDFAGRLIEASGLKGRRAGRARISERHANFIVNEGGARAVEVKLLMELAQRAVWERSGVWLEPEVRLVGRW